MSCKVSKKIVTLTWIGLDVNCFESVIKFNVFKCYVANTRNSLFWWNTAWTINEVNKHTHTHTHTHLLTCRHHSSLWYCALVYFHCNLKRDLNFKIFLWILFKKYTHFRLFSAWQRQNHQNFLLCNFPPRHWSLVDRSKNVDLNISRKFCRDKVSSKRAPCCAADSNSWPNRSQNFEYTS